MSKVDQKKRSFIKKALLAAGTVLALSGQKKAKAATKGASDEVLYRETEAFRAYYESLRR